MKNIQIIDGAVNCVYDIFAASDDDFSLIFPAGQNVAFIDEVYTRGSKVAIDAAFERIWKARIPKRLVQGIHGLLFYDLEQKKIYHPTRVDEEAINPGGSRLR